MKANYLKSDYYEKVFFIEFGGQCYEIFEYQIAYVQKSNGITFIADSNEQRFPISIKSLDEFYSKLNPEQFFKISNDTIVNRDEIFYLDEYKNYVLLTFNFKKTIALKISSKKIDEFKKWLNDT